MRCFIFTFVFFISNINSAEIYRCDSQNSVIFTQFPCKAGQIETEFTLKTVNTSSVPFADKNILDDFTQKQTISSIKSRIKAIRHKIVTLKQDRQKQLDALEKPSFDAINQKEHIVRLKKRQDKRTHISQKYQYLINLQQEERKRLEKKIIFYQKKSR